jgi:hypothetical protein
MNAYPITKQNKLEEKRKINEILMNNNYKNDVFKKGEKHKKPRSYYTYK